MSKELQMSCEVAKEALFKLNFEYMSHPPNEREKLYPEYQQSRKKIQDELRQTVYLEKEKTIN